MAYLELQMTYDRCGCDRDKITDLCGGGRPPRVDVNEIANDPRVRAHGEAPAAILALGVNERVSREYAKYRRPVRLCLGVLVVGSVLYQVMYSLFYVPGRLRCDAGAACGTNGTRQALDGCCNFFCCSNGMGDSRELPVRPYGRWDDWLNATGPACAIYEQPDELRRKDAYYECDNCAEEEWRCGTFYEGRASHYEVAWPLVFWIPILGSIVAMVVLPQLKFGQLRRVYAEAFADWLARGIVTHVHVVRGCTLKPKALRLYFERPPEGYPRTMSRGDFAVGGFWVVSLSLFIAGQQQRLYLPQRDKHKADPLFYTGIVLIAIATPVLLCYIVVRVSRASAAARVANPVTDESDPDEWVSLLPGGLLTFKGKRERPDARFWSRPARKSGGAAPSDVGFDGKSALASSSRMNFHTGRRWRCDWARRPSS